ncbi:hypothetical protein [Cytobacillus purgationiresistens]|uniref:hypothetical protein n=1 Tax=Cytobacillus purgationiresistens TaxID=863449 RepID=UPI0035218AEC
MKSKERPEFLFISPMCQLVKMANYADILETLCKRPGLMQVSPHMFRHTHETMLWESNISKY